VTNTRGENKMNKQINVINVNEGDLILIQHSEATNLELAMKWHEKIAETLEGTAISLITVTPHAQLTVLKKEVK
jgi:hypothetical protein